MNISLQLQQKASELGFDIFGISSPYISKRDIQSYKEWLQKKYNSDMVWMDNSKRINVKEIMPEVQSIISVGINYYNPDMPIDMNSGRVSKYSRGKDYHEIFWIKLKSFAEFIEKNFPEVKVKYYADTGPILERSYAANAGLGFIGKNTCLINVRYGSWILIAEILVSLKLDKIKQKRFDKSKFTGCGSCSRCINACPTGALEAPFVLNANKCISYLTIENKGSIPIELREKIGNRLFGCDICQDVCPWNISRQQKASLKEFVDKPIAGDKLLLKEILTLRNDQEFKKRFFGSPLLRAKRKGLMRNACVVAGNIADKSMIPILENLLEEDEVIAEHAAWAIDQIQSRT